MDNLLTDQESGELPRDFYISPTPEDLAVRAFTSGFIVEAKLLAISPERLLALLIRALQRKMC